MVLCCGIGLWKLQKGYSGVCDRRLDDPAWSAESVPIRYKTQRTSKSIACTDIKKTVIN